MTTDQVVNISIVVLGLLVTFSAYQFRLILSNRETIARSEEREKHYKIEMERRLKETKEENERRSKELKEEMERRFQERRDDRLHEQTLFEFQMKALSERYDSQNTLVKSELIKIEVSMGALHKRLDDFLNTKALQN